MFSLYTEGEHISKVKMFYVAIDISDQLVPEHHQRGMLPLIEETSLHLIIYINIHLPIIQ